VKPFEGCQGRSNRLCMRCQWDRMHLKFFCILKSFRIWFSFFKVFQEKHEGRNLVPANPKNNCLFVTPLQHRVTMPTTGNDQLQSAIIVSQISKFISKWFLLRGKKIPQQQYLAHVKKTWILLYLSSKLFVYMNIHCLKISLFLLTYCIFEAALASPLKESGCYCLEKKKNLGPKISIECLLILLSFIIRKLRSFYTFFILTVFKKYHRFHIEFSKIRRSTMRFY
jgi:hypothetical protein